ncbi:Lysosomal acid lipase/cholesteryl ester hydrolase [Geodia barretti]|uniref:Lysosomal acid lipase/cholesteryl ester hydrolase n=1 Tax=Geodia barretti TaxID=519541 RepID=A0AA35SL27_GEOBA|nr:Lysosomal acid lipase/cholesteryl ester hydrolase [Geodia barretti]
MMAGSRAVLEVVLVTSILAVVGSVDPEVHMDAIELIKSKGYPAERHYVTTPDGYILQMHRIPYSKNANGSSNITRPVFFLQHGLLCSSTNWLTNLANESFAFILSDAGFDVWMGNVRGNTYSRNHTHLTVHDKAFWNFSFDQHSLIDLPAMLTKTMEISTQNKLFYAGHSQGTIMGFAGFTANKTLADHITAFFALAPVTTVKDVKGLFAAVEYVYKPLETRIPVYYSHTPAGTSVKNIVHYAKEMKSGKFRKYDYGTEGNLKAYGTREPPNYNTSELSVPTALFSGGHDWLADPDDVARLVPQIKDTVFNHTNISYYEHLDFIWGLDARYKVYDPIIEMTKKFL